MANLVLLHTKPSYYYSFSAFSRDPSSSSSSSFNYRPAVILPVKSTICTSFLWLFPLSHDVFEPCLVISVCVYLYIYIYIYHRVWGTILVITRSWSLLWESMGYPQWLPRSPGLIGWGMLLVCSTRITGGELSVPAPFSIGISCNIIHLKMTELSNLLIFLFLCNVFNMRNGWIQVVICFLLSR